jgi:hypothetical protein
MHAIWNAFGMVTLSKVWGWGQKGFSLKFSYIGMTRMAVCLILAIVSCYPTYYLFRKPDISLHWTFVWPSKSNCIVSMAIVGNEQPSSCLTDWLLTGLIQPSSVYQFAHSATKTDFGRIPAEVLPDYILSLHSEIEGNWKKKSNGHFGWCGG